MSVSTSPLQDFSNFRFTTDFNHKRSILGIPVLNICLTYNIFFDSVILSLF